MKVRLAAIVVMVLLLATACGGETHTTIADALRGQAGDAVDLGVLRVQEDAWHVPRNPQRDLIRFVACDRHGDCMEFEQLTTSDQIARVEAGERLQAGEFWEMLGGSLEVDDVGIVRVRGTPTISQRPDDWPEG